MDISSVKHKLEDAQEHLHSFATKDHTSQEKQKKELTTFLQTIGNELNSMEQNPSRETTHLTSNNRNELLQTIRAMLRDRPAIESAGIEARLFWKTLESLQGLLQPSVRDYKQESRKVKPVNEAEF